ncbi:hemagglutinin repeat-containing protein, partial [Escherichia coli]|nr:hemagglutinin repeat-containing protein [Escherichia coli]
KGSEKGNGTEWTETTTDSGKTVTINSGRDTVLNGAQVNGNRIIADVGHDLLISSQQDTSKYDSKQTSVAAGGSFTFGSMTGSGYIAASRDKMKSRFDSVAEQTGMFAGDGGFDITVGRHTQLDGAVIASTATPDKNHLDTGTLGFSDLHNEADYKVSHSGISLSGGGSFGDKFQGNMPGGMISAGGHSGHAEGTTQAAVADGTIIIRDRDNQKQNLANLSRDPVHANDSISPIFDKEKEQRRLQTVGLISDIGSQVADIVRTQGELNALKAAQDKYGPVPADATEEQRQAYLAKLRDTPEYKKEQEKYGTGSDMQRGIQAATAALQGLAGGNMAGALAGASAPELANIIGHHAGIDDNTAAKAIAHAILGGVTAALQGNSAAAGAIGAGTGEVIASAIAKSLYPDVDPSKLTEEQKQTVSTLATLSAGMAGGIASGDVAGAAAGAGAGKNVVENNALGNKNDKLPPIIPINPLPIGVEGADGEPLNGGGGIAKGGKSKDTQIWTETKKVEPVGNAYGHWTKHGKEFPEYQNAKQYVDAAHNFMTNPPPGTLTKTRPNGDTLYYNPVTNVFASKDINGVPRTMFKPEKGIEYWNKQ